VLKQDISATRLRAIAPLIGGTAGVDYLRSAFSARYQLTTVSSFVEVEQQLPKTVNWFTEALKGLEQEKLELETSLAPVQATLHSLPAGSGIPPLSSMRTGGRLGVATTAASPAGPALLSAGMRFSFFHTFISFVPFVQSCETHITPLFWEFFQGRRNFLRCSGNAMRPWYAWDYYKSSAVTRPRMWAP
jgi:hypothetical protein